MKDYSVYRRSRRSRLPLLGGDMLQNLLTFMPWLVEPIGVPCISMIAIMYCFLVK